jgi:hemolysin activation/secretion protein
MIFLFYSRRKRMRVKIINLIFLFLFFNVVNISGHKGFCQITGQYEKMEREIELEKELRKRIEKEVEKPKIEEEKEKEEVEKEEIRVFIKEIKVVGVTLFSKEEIRKIVAPYENQELSLRDIYKIADLITDLYRKNGYLTSRAYVPPQDLSDGILEIRVIEGKMGEVQIKGNRYFSTKLLRKKIRLKKGDYFNYNLLRKSLIKINEHPDRTARAVLIPGKEPGTTDVILEVKDRLPIHFGFDYDNFGSRYIGRDRLALTLDHNNLTGNDDMLTLKFQKADANTYTLKSARYLLPIGDTYELGFFIARSKLKLGEEYKATDARGKSTLLSVFINKYLQDEEDLSIRLTAGFDYKHIRNYLLGAESSKDEMRVAKLGIDVDKSDRLGRTIFVTQFNYGIPNLWGGLDTVDPSASREGAGGKFVKWEIDLLRLQRLPLDSTLLWKNHIQISPYILTAAEQFQIGGIINNRGYPPAEKVGDEGCSSTLELSLPIYILPREWRVPFCEEKLYDSLRFITFYDWAHVDLHNPQVGEEKHETLRSLGCGLRLSLPKKDLLVRVEFGWPLDETPSDEDHLHVWLEVSKIF